MSMFQENLKKLTGQYSQKYIAHRTGFSQSSINNYLSKSSEPSMQFLIALKEAFGISIDDFLFSSFDAKEQVSYEQFIGNYMIYYYNNDSYKGEIHLSLKNTLNYGVLSIFKNKEFDREVNVVATFTKNQSLATKLLKRLNASDENILKIYQENGSIYNGTISRSEQSLFLDLENKDNRDKCFIILNNPPTINKYIGGVGTVNSIARGREHNPCVQFIILTKKLLDVPDGELNNILAFDKLNINLDLAIKDIIELFKRIYIDKNELSVNLSETQKQAIVKNKLEYYFNEILEANLFRFAKVSNREDDSIYKLIREGIDV